MSADTRYSSKKWPGAPLSAGGLSIEQRWYDCAVFQTDCCCPAAPLLTSHCCSMMPYKPPTKSSMASISHDIHRECVASVERVLTRHKSEYALVGREELDRQHISKVRRDATRWENCYTTTGYVAPKTWYHALGRRGGPLSRNIFNRD